MLNQINLSITYTDIIAISGLIIAIPGLVLGILNYLRDQSNLNVTLQWDMKSVKPELKGEEKMWGLVTVTNCGRRPVYISHIALRLPKKYKDYSHLLLREGISGQRLVEGDAPATFLIDSEGMEKYNKDWKKIRAEVSMSTGKKKLSDKIKKIPSWAINSHEEP